MSLTTEQTEWFSQTFAQLVANVEQAIVGKTDVVRLAFVALLAEGHLLLEDYPGTGKTSLARAIAQTIQGEHHRIQFTPDLLPSAADLDDPLSFRAEATPPEELSEDEFDAELRKLLDGPDSTGSASTDAPEE